MTEVVNIQMETSVACTGDLSKISTLEVVRSMLFGFWQLPLLFPRQNAADAPARQLC